MSVKTSIPMGLLAAFDVNERGLQRFVKSQRAAFYRMSDRWKATDRAAVISDWLDRLGAAIPKGRVRAIHVEEARRAPGVLAIVTPSIRHGWSGAR